MKKTILFTLAASALLLASCGGGSSTTSQNTGLNPGTSETSSQESSEKQTSSAQESSSEEATSSEEIVFTGTDVFYAEGIRGGGETESPKNPGKFLYWSGDGGTIYDFTYNTKKDAYVVEYGNVAEPNAENGWGWYGCQIFYTAPYALPGDTYTFHATINSDVEGDFTMNGKVVHVKKGDNNIVETFTRGEEGGAVVATIGIQLGTADAANKVWTTMQGSILSFKGIELYEAAGTYHCNKFMSQDTLVKEIEVRDGKGVVAPEVEAPEGMILKGWYDGNAVLTSGTLITEEHTWVASFVSEAEAASIVTVYRGTEVIDTVKVVTGSTINLNKIAAPFAYKAVSYYTDAELTEAFDPSTPISADLTLYGKYVIDPVFWINSEEAGWTFHDEVGYDDNGDLVLTFNGWGDAAYFVQVNFPLPIGEAGKTYTVSFKYRINAEGGDYKIYDGADITTAESLEVKEAFNTASVTYDGGYLTTNNKLTFELGAIPAGDVPVVFELGNVKLTIA